MVTRPEPSEGREGTNPSGARGRNRDPDTAAAGRVRSNADVLQGIWLVIGTDTGVGKTVFAAWFVRWLRSKGVTVEAAKPVASGGRGDARALQRALGRSGSLDSINPWSFRAVLTPMIAARREGLRVGLDEVLRFLKARRPKAGILVVESAGGLRSPLGENWDSLDLVRRLDAVPVLVAANRLGVLNHARLTMDAMPFRARRAARIVLMDPPSPGRVARGNAETLESWYGTGRVVRFPWLPAGGQVGDRLPGRIDRGLVRLVWGPGGEER